MKFQLYFCRRSEKFEARMCKYPFLFITKFFIMNEKEMKDPVSYFKNFHDSEPTVIPMSQVYQLITSGLFREATEKVRYYLSAGLAGDAEKEKKKLSCIVCSTICKGGRRKANVESYTGIAMVDADDVAPSRLPSLFRLLEADPYVLLAHSTSSGEGLRIFYRTDVTNTDGHLQAFRQGNAYFSRLLGIETDDKCKDLTRASLLSYAPDAVYHPDADILHIDLTTTDKENCRKRRHTSKTHHALAGDVLPTLTEELRAEGVVYKEGHRNDFLSRIAYRMNRYGVNAVQLEDFMQTEFPDFPKDELSGIIRSVYAHTEEHGMQKFIHKKTTLPYASILDMENFLNAEARFRLNVITRQCEFHWNEPTESDMHPQEEWQEVTDYIVNTLWSRMSKTGVRVGLSDLYNVLHSEFVPLFNPFTAYFDTLPEWDGRDYIDELTSTIRLAAPYSLQEEGKNLSAETDDNRLFSEYFKKWFVAIIPSLLEKDIVNHEIFVLIGKQGCGKTTWLHHLLPPQLRRYFYTKTNSSRFNKDDLLTLAEFMLVCLEELEKKSDFNDAQVKAMMTMPDIHERAAYAHNKEHRVHIASFCGTGNSSQFLSDPTGNRRWLPFEVESIDYETPVNHTGIYSQALTLWKSGFRYWFDQDEILRLNRHNTRFEQPNLEEELVLTYYRVPVPGEFGSVVSVANILERINSAIRQPLSAIKIGLLMRELGFKPVRNNKQRGYRVIERTQDEIRISRQAIARYTMDYDIPSNDTEENETQLDF